MTTEPETIKPTDFPDYSDLFESLGTMVEQNPNQALAAALLLNCCLTISVLYLGRERLERDLRGAIDRLPQIEAQLNRCCIKSVQ